MAELGLAGSELSEELRDGAGLDAAAQKSVQLLRPGVHLLHDIGNERGIGDRSTIWSRLGGGEGERTRLERLPLTVVGWNFGYAVL